MRNGGFTVAKIFFLFLSFGSLFSQAQWEEDSAALVCIPYSVKGDRGTPAISLYCRGFDCDNVDDLHYRQATVLLNQSSLRGFVPPEGKTSLQICEGVSRKPIP